MKFHLNLSIWGCQDISSAVFYLVSVAPKSPLPVLSPEQEKPARDSPTHKGWDPWALGAGGTPGQHRDAARKPQVALLDSSRPQLKPPKNLAIWSEQVRFMLSGQRWPGLEGKLSHFSTSIKHLGCISHSSPTAKSTAQAMHISLMGNARQNKSHHRHRPQLQWTSPRKRFLLLRGEDLMPTVAGYPSLPGAPTADAAALHCQTILIRLCCTEQFRCFSPHGSSPTEFNRITHVEGSLAPCPLATEPWKHRFRCRLHLSCILSGWSPHHHSSAARGSWPD